MSNDENLVEVIKTIQQGTAATDEQGLVLKAAQTQMSVMIVSTMASIQESTNRLSASLDRLITKYTESLIQALDNDLITRDEMFDAIQAIQNKQLQVADLYRKIVQSPNKLFADSDYSEDEKKVVRLFKSFKTNEERAAFLKICEEQLTKLNSFE